MAESKHEEPAKAVAEVKREEPTKLRFECYRPCFWNGRGWAKGAQIEVDAKDASKLPRHFYDISKPIPESCLRPVAELPKRKPA